MPKLQSLQQDRRRAENDVLAMKARLRLLRDTAEQNERKAARNRELKSSRDAIQGDADWQREALEQEFMRRDFTHMEKRVVASQQRNTTKARLAQSRRLVEDSRAATASKKREDTQCKLDAAYAEQQREWERRRAMAYSKRAHAKWYQEAASAAAKEFADRTSEMRLMGMAEEETRSWMINERAEHFKDALAFEEQRLKEVLRERDDASQELRRQSKHGASLFAGRGNRVGPGAVNPAFSAASAATSTYSITGPGMATVKRCGTNSMTRVHFPFGYGEQRQFGFSPGNHAPIKPPRKSGPPLNPGFGARTGRF